MNPTPHTALLVGLTLALVAMFASGFYWLATKHCPVSAHSPVTRLPTRPANANQSAFELGEVDEWGALTPYPDHALHAGQSAAFPFDDDEPFEPTDSQSRLHETHAASRPEPESASYASSHSGEAITSTDVAIHCPHCRSSRVDTLNIGRKVGSAIGSVAGATSGMAMAFSGAEAGAAFGMIGGPVGSLFGGLAGAVIAGLVGSAAGCAAGSAVGSTIDDNMLNNYRCRSCGQVFGNPRN